MSNYDKYDIIPYYSIPIFISQSILMLISATVVWGPYKVIVEGLQARLLGGFFLFFAVNGLYEILIKWPRSIGGDKKKDEVLSIFLSSYFFYSLLLLFISIVSYIFLKNEILFYLYILLLLLCLYAQYIFIKKIRTVLDVKID